MKPNNVDIFTSYRYYDEENIRQYYIIILLKKIGFTLDDIKQYKDNLTDNVLINQRQKLLDEIFEKKEIIKKLDQVRNNIVDGKIVLDEFDYEINNIETRKYSKGDYYERK